MTSPEFLALQQALAGRYSLEREIGRGGMGIVFLARDVALDRPVAIKLLPPDMASAELRERFLREAKTAAQLSHPHIVPIHLVEQRDGLVFFVMAFVEGESVGDRVRRTGALPTGEVIRMVQEVAWALAYAHGRGVVHRDVKPDNILFERASGRALLTDFGIARHAEAVAATTPGVILGSLQYMAPEQADANAALDGRADIYALGVTGFYALSERLPFEADRPAALIAAHLLEPAPPLATVVSDVPPRLAEVIDRCLAKDPQLRWQTGEALADALNEVRLPVRMMPPSIRAFAQSLPTALSQVMLLILVGGWVSILVPEVMPTLFWLLGLVALLPFVDVLQGARAVAIAGFSTDDVLQAVFAERKLSDRYTEYLRGEVSKLPQQVKTIWWRIFIGLLGALELGAGGGAIVDAIRTGGVLDIVGSTIMGVLIGWMGVEMIGHGLQVGPFKDRIGRFLMANQHRAEATTRRLWSSWFVRGWLALGRMTPGRQPRADVQHRPTEAILAAAAADVFAALPTEDRRRVAAVPDLVRKLEGHAARLRARLSTLDEAMSAVGDPALASGRGRALDDMKVARQRVDEQLRSTMEAIENVRLDLLRLRAGVGTTADLTEAIDVARRLGEEIDYTIAGREASARILSPS